MTPRQRLFAALEGSPTDRTPVWLLFPYNPTGYYVDVRTHPRYCPLFERSLECAVTLNRRNFRVPLHTPEVAQRREEFREGDLELIRQHVEYQGHSIFSQTCVADSFKNHRLLNSPEDLEFFCSLPVETNPDRIQATLDNLLPEYLREKEAFPPHYGAMMLDLGEPIGPLYGSSNLEEYAIWSLTHDDMIVAWLQRVLERCRLIYRYCLERDLADVYFMVGSELASPPLVSRSTFQRWIVPFARDLIDLVHSYGKKVIQHYHGQIAEILPDFLDMQPDGLHTIEAPPTGDCTMPQAYEVVGDRITLIGNVQYDEFRSATTEQMAASVTDLLEECRDRRFILSPTAGPFDPDPPESIIRNYRVFLETAWEYGNEF
jgi:uroporphyrinogen-III decarboxylase